MSGTGFQGRDPNRDDKPSHVRLPGASHIPVVPSPMQPTGDLIKSYHVSPSSDLSRLSVQSLLECRKYYLNRTASPSPS